MTNILSTLRGSGIFCVKLVRNTSKLLSRMLYFYANDEPSTDQVVDDSQYYNPPEPENFRWPSSTNNYVPDAPSRSDSQCSCMSCALPPRLTERQRRPSRLIEGVSAEKFYKIGDLLGEGTFSKVYLAETKLAPGGLVAVKVIEKCSLIRKKSPANAEDDLPVQPEVDLPVVPEEVEVEYEDLRWLIDREIQVMSALDHPHIIHLEEVYEDDDRVSFILELAKGGEVFDRLVEKVTFTEAETADLLVQLLCAVSFMHEHGIVHRDLKLENLLYYDDTEDSKILVADFGLSEYEWELKEGSPVCGTPGYLAPEVIARQPCTTAADVWSIGVVAYILLAGYPPFFANPDEPDTDATLFKKILTGDFKFHENSWNHVSPEARDFIRCLLCPDPLQRPTCEEALCHPWLNDRQNLEIRSVQKSAQNSLVEDEEKWSATQHIAFGLSLAIIVYSYLGLLTYMLNLGDASFILLEHFQAEFFTRASSVIYIFSFLNDHIDWLSSQIMAYTSPFFIDQSL